MTTYYADSSTGAYLGGYSGDHTPPTNSTTVETAPHYATQTWNGTSWVGAYQGDLMDNTDAVAFQLLYGNAPWELFSLFPLLKFYGDQPASRMGAWAVIKGQAPSWLTQDLIDNMESWCADNNMPLVP